MVITSGDHKYFMTSGNHFTSYPVLLPRSGPPAKKSLAHGLPCVFGWGDRSQKTEFRSSDNQRLRESQALQAADFVSCPHSDACFPCSSPRDKSEGSGKCPTQERSSGFRISRMWQQRYAHTHNPLRTFIVSRHGAARPSRVDLVKRSFMFENGPGFDFRFQGKVH
jgi:hypothetical protein